MIRDHSPPFAAIPADSRRSATAFDGARRTSRIRSMPPPSRARGARAGRVTHASVRARPVPGPRAPVAAPVAAHVAALSPIVRCAAAARRPAVGPACRPRAAAAPHRPPRGKLPNPGKRRGELPYNGRVLRRPVRTDVRCAAQAAAPLFALRTDRAAVCPTGAFREPSFPDMPPQRRRPALQPRAPCALQFLPSA
ncbi:hypothetical protein GSH04_22000 [Burkholderia pseudomallei]|nr:hypothetical protein [Burkholderia pseudomallei]MBM5631274.1 hypothetical protein [Burkholderia pseudomallei]MBM5660855.1 hypothetical protein [Burkholderia pseudomallei]